jgi:hypothetical protein
MLRSLFPEILSSPKQLVYFVYNPLMDEVFNF